MTSRAAAAQALATDPGGLDSNSAADFVVELQRLLSSGDRADANLAWSRISGVATQLQRARVSLREAYGLNEAAHPPPPPPPRVPKRSAARIPHHSAAIAPPPPAAAAGGGAAGSAGRAAFCGGNCEAILGAMAKYPDHEALQLRGCRALQARHAATLRCYAATGLLLACCVPRRTASRASEANTRGGGRRAVPVRRTRELYSA